MKNLNLIIILISVVFLGFTGYQYREEILYFFTGETVPHVWVGNVRFEVTIAADDYTRTKGLSGTEQIGEFEGMLFVFDNSDFHSFWMKGMKYPIDILWIDEDAKIVHIEEGVDPETYPRSFRPSKPARYVLELHSGSVRNFNFDVGETVSLPRL